MITAPKFHPGTLVAELKRGDLKGVRVAFITAPLREPQRPNVPPNGPGLMAARLREYGAEVMIIDLNGYRIVDEDSKKRNLPNGRFITPEEAKSLICDYFSHHGEPDLIALSGIITTLRWQGILAKILKNLAPDAFLISGNGLATEFKEGLFRWIPELDGIGHSEGDDIILLIAADVKRERQQKGKLYESPYYAGFIDGKDRWIYHGNRPKDLDILPFPAWDLLEKDVRGHPLLEDYIKTEVWGMKAQNSSAAPFSMKRSLTTVSSRGCPYACAFCYRGAQGERNWGLRSPENLAAEVDWLKRHYGVDFVGFPDDNFAVRIDRCQALPEAFDKIGGIRWGTHTRLDEADLERITPMAKAGCIYIGFGAESASERTLTAMNKGGHILRNGVVEFGGYRFPKTMIDGIKNCREVGIHANCTWIMGYPGETLDDLKVSVAFILWQHELYTQGLTPGTPEYANAYASVNRRMFTATAYPGTAMARHPRVRELLGENFGMKFDPKTFEPVCDDASRWYVEELDDATKIVHDKNGNPLNYSEMSNEVFLEARGYIDSGNLEKVLNM